MARMIHPSRPTRQQARAQARSGLRSTRRGRWLLALAPALILALLIHGWVARPAAAQEPAPAGQSAPQTAAEPGLGFAGEYQFPDDSVYLRAPV